MRSNILSKQVKTLELSIVKWEGIVSGTESDDGPSNCECCIEYRNKHNDEVSMCNGCPISSDVLKVGCSGTPYENWVNYFKFSKSGAGRVVYNDITKKLAAFELIYLRELLLRLKVE